MSTSQFLEEDAVEGVVLVTGATSGIGRATAVELASAGLAVVVAGRRTELGEGLVAELAEEGRQARFVACDVGSESDVVRLVATAANWLGRLDGVVNNAGTYFAGSVEDTSPEVWRQVMDVNVGGAYRVSREAIPHLRRTGGGSIVNIASVHAFASQPRVAAYAASKGAVIALTRQMALDLAEDRIRVNAVAVGGVDTEMAAASFRAAGTTPDAAGWTTDSRAVGRMGQPADIARVIRFLLSPDASFMTGSVVVADAGLLARL